MRRCGYVWLRRIGARPCSRSGQQLRVTAQPVAGPITLGVVLARIDAGGETTLGSLHGTHGQAVDYISPVIAIGGWHAVGIYTATAASGTYTARVGLAPGSDDFPSATSDGYAMAHAQSLAATFTGVGDADSFKIDAPPAAVGTSIAAYVSASGAFSATIYGPTGGVVASGTSSPIVGTVGLAGSHVLVVTGSSPVTYSTSFTLGCAIAGSCDDRALLSPSAIDTERTRAGRLFAGGGAASYTVNLAEGQHASFSVSDTDASNVACRFRLDLLAPAPPTQRLFGSEPIARWRGRSSTSAVAGPDTGAAALNPNGAGGFGAGGHVLAAIGGTYTIRVALDAGSSGACPYRLLVAKGATVALPDPAW